VEFENTAGLSGNGCIESHTTSVQACDSEEDNVKEGTVFTILKSGAYLLTYSASFGNDAGRLVLGVTRKVHPIEHKFQLAGSKLFAGEARTTETLTTVAHFQKGDQVYLLNNDCCRCEAGSTSVLLQSEGQALCDAQNNFEHNCPLINCAKGESHYGVVGSITFLYLGDVIFPE